MAFPQIEHVAIKDDVFFGENVRIIEPVNLYGCMIGDNTFIGPFVEIQADVKIGDNCKIQSHSFICELVTIGNNTVIAHGVVFINDRFSNGHPANGDKSLWKQTTVGNNVSIGSNATILPVAICDNVVVGAGAVVKKILPSREYMRVIRHKKLRIYDD
jgi:acetyltransferase-like isoleucine patch superfamily enzyme